MNHQQSLKAPPIIGAPPRASKWWLALLLLLAAALLVLFRFNPSQYGFYPRCAFYLSTGLYCPGCGALRATHQLVHGHLLTAMRCNVLLVLSVPFAAYFLLRQIRCWMTRQPAPPFVLRARWLIAIGIILLVFTILRNIRVEPFTWLAPP